MASDIIFLLKEASAMLDHSTAKRLHTRAMDHLAQGMESAKAVEAAWAEEVGF